MKLNLTWTAHSQLPCLPPLICYNRPNSRLPMTMNKCLLNLHGARKAHRTGSRPKRVSEVWRRGIDPATSQYCRVPCTDAACLYLRKFSTQYYSKGVHCCKANVQHPERHLALISSRTPRHRSSPGSPPPRCSKGPPNGAAPPPPTPAMPRQQGAHMAPTSAARWLLCSGQTLPILQSTALKGWRKERPPCRQRPIPGSALRSGCKTLTAAPGAPTTWRATGGRGSPCWPAPAWRR